MAIYEFVCEKCKKDFESLIFNEQEEKDLKCKNCGSKKIKKVLSTFSFEINGFNAGNGYSKKKD